VSLYQDTNKLKVGSVGSPDPAMDSPFVDDLTYDHILGQGFTGFVYKICFHTYAKDTYTVWDSNTCQDTVECSVCPQTTCLSTCAMDEYINW
jgi:hypothetical protein